MTSGGSAFAHTLYLVAIVVWCALELRQARQKRPEANVNDRGSRAVLQFSYTIAIAGALIAKMFAPSASIRFTPLTDWGGLIIVYSGIGLRFWSMQTLGRYFTFTVQTSKDQPVISAGPYRVVRHPGYAGVLIAFVGFGLFLSNWASLGTLTAAATGGLVYRITIEERALARDLGGRYQAYAAHRKRLVPFVW